MIYKLNYKVLLGCFIDTVKRLVNVDNFACFLMARDGLKLAHLCASSLPIVLIALSSTQDITITLERLNRDVGRPSRTRELLK